MIDLIANLFQALTEPAEASRTATRRWLIRVGAAVIGITVIVTVSGLAWLVLS